MAVQSHENLKLLALLQLFILEKVQDLLQLRPLEYHRPREPLEFCNFQLAVLFLIAKIPLEQRPYVLCSLALNRNPGRQAFVQNRPAYFLS